MKIISGFKDYYDYLQGVYGVDEKIIYERHCRRIWLEDKWKKVSVFKPHPGTHSVSGYYLAICGVIYCAYKMEEDFHFGVSAEDLKAGKYAGYLKRMDKQERQSFEKMIYNDSHTGWPNPKLEHQNRYHLTETTINEEENCPVVLLELGYKKFDPLFKNVKLYDFGINQIIKPHDIYIQISNFLSREKPVADNRTDVQKLTGKGFDKKTSFRKM